MLSAAQQPAISKLFNRYRWLALVLVAVLPLWLIGTLDRGLWTPDEPREADIVWRMSTQADHVLPELAGQKFLEKPPLSYWAAGLSTKLFGDSAAAMRIPNLLYAFITTIAVGTLAFTMAGRKAALIAAMLAASSFQTLRVELWLAPDACLLAGSALALLGLYRAYSAKISSQQLSGYTLMHIGALLGFMAKSAVGWLVPLLTLIVLIAWDRRWKEWLNWRLWIGFILQIVVIGSWIAAVLRENDGLNDVRILFWNNLAGRFAHIATHGATDYAGAHLNWPGKYLSELPYYLFPWTLLLIPAMRRAWFAVREANASHTMWRFAVASWLPLSVLLSCAVTARDVYFAPALIGICLTMALWFVELPQQLGRLETFCLTGTRYLAGLLLLIVTACIVLLTLSHSLPFDERISWIIGSSSIVLLSFAAVTLWHARSAQRNTRYLATMIACYLTTVVTLSVGIAVGASAADRWQDLRQLALSITHDVGNAKLALLRPDETTIAMLDHYARRQAVELDGQPSDTPNLLADWFYARSAQTRVLLLLPGHASGPLSQWLARFGRQKETDDGELASIEAEHLARVVARYELPQGRRYALLAPLPQQLHTHCFDCD